MIISIANAITAGDLSYGSSLLLVVHEGLYNDA
jgi:hypothetical protein